MALAGTALVHLTAIFPALLLVSHPVSLNSPTHQTVTMVFAEPTQQLPLQDLPAPQTVETPPSRVQVLAPQDQPSPPLSELPQQPSARPPDPHPPEAQVAPATARDPEPIPLPPPAAPLPPLPRQSTAPQRIVTPPRRASATPILEPERTWSASSPAKTSLPSRPATVSVAWREALAAWLAEHKIYPEQARRQGIEGSVTLRFSVDPSGHVVDVTVLRGSGSPLLDLAAEAMLRDARLPAPAPAIQDRMTISVQVHYKLAD